MSKFLDVTLIIPTHNRVHYLESVLEYYINEKKMDAQIIICDSSSIKYDGSFLDKGNVVYNYWPTLTFPEKLVTALKSVSSKYVLVSPDDDYYALDNLEDLKEVLDTNQDVTSVDGKTVLFNNEMQVTPTGMYKKSLDEESVIERLTYGYANYFPTVYSLYRTEFICNIYEKMIKYKIESHGFFEYTFFALSLIDGKHICMDNFHFARDISSTSPTPEFRGNKDEFGYHYNTNSNDYNQFICVRYGSNDIKLLEYAQQYNIDYLEYANINKEESIETLSQYKCDLFISMSFDQIFKRETINLPKYKTINCHAGKLPFYRGRNILNWALINDEKEFGITVHFVDEGIDTGDIILQKLYTISDSDDYRTLLERSYHACADLLYDAIVLFKNKQVITQKQDTIDPIGFYCTQRQVGDEIIEWNQTSRTLFNFVRAICKPGPMARTILNGKEMKINKIRYIAEAPYYKGIEGAILSKTKMGFYVKTKDSFIEVLDFEYNGNFKVGDRFE
jgi:methionyl-tRNA formyltransferase